MAKSSLLEQRSAAADAPRTPIKATAGATSPAVTVAAAALKSVTPSGTFVGRVQAVNTVNLVSRVEGFLQKRAFTEGQQVKTGDLLFVIEQDTYQAAVDQAQAQLVSAQATERNAALALQRSQELVKTNAVAQATVDQNLVNQGTAAAAVRSAQAALEQANINLAFAEIKAPIDGRIGMANVSVGNFVNQATGTLATIVSQNPIYVLFPATTQQVLDYRQRSAKTLGAGAKAVVRAILPNGQEYPHPGSVDFLDIQANSGRRHPDCARRIPQSRQLARLRPDRQRDSRGRRADAYAGDPSGGAAGRSVRVLRARRRAGRQG